MNYLIVSLLWIGYCILHSLLISISFTKYITNILKGFFAFYRLFYVLISLVLLIPLINYTAQIDRTVIISYSFPWSIVRNIFMYGSLVMFFWAFFFSYDPLAFFGIRQILGFKKKNEKIFSSEIKKSGLLGVVRHPMYLALIIYLWTQTFSTVDIIVNIILTIYVVIGTLLEEKKLIFEFGDSYKQYQEQVPMLIPFTK
jgi:methanethiol S-methyltransferase